MPMESMKISRTDRALLIRFFKRLYTSYFRARRAERLREKIRAIITKKRDTQKKKRIMGNAQRALNVELKSSIQPDRNSYIFITSKNRGRVDLPRAPKAED